jgi:hypothetical protein
MHQSAPNSGRAFRAYCFRPVSQFNHGRNWALLVSVTGPTDKRILLIVKLSNFRAYIYRKCTLIYRPLCSEAPATASLLSTIGTEESHAQR